jgi:hypothetical protein
MLVPGQVAPALFGVMPHAPREQVLSKQAPGSGQSFAVRHATHFPVPSHLPTEHVVPADFDPATHALLVHEAVAHSPEAGQGAAWIIRPSALHVTKLFPSQLFEFGMHVLHVFTDWLQPFPSHDFSSANAEPSALHVLSDAPSLLQVAVLGTQVISPQPPASALHNAAD